MEDALYEMAFDRFASMAEKIRQEAINRLQSEEVDREVVYHMCQNLLLSLEAGEEVKAMWKEEVGKLLDSVSPRYMTDALEHFIEIARAHNM